MSRPLSALLGALAAVAAGLGLLAVPLVASAVDGPRIHNLSVLEGGDAWRTENEFRLRWDPSPARSGGDEPLVYLVRDAAGTALGQPLHADGADGELHPVRIPSAAGADRAAPGQYEVEVWYESEAADGAHAHTTLRFDNARPNPARALAPASWIRAGAEVRVEIEHPAGPFPVSGIRGYAVAVDHGSGGLPCAGADSCSLAETDLRSGVEDDSISLGPLAEGTNVVVVLAVAGSGLRSEAASRTPLRVDGGEPRVSLSGAPQGWSERPVRLTAIASDSQSGVVAAGPAGPLTSIAIDGGIPTTAAGAAVTTTVRGDGVHSVVFYGRDAVGNSGEARPASATIRVDETPPRLAFTKTQDPAEPERIEATVTDSLSGASSTIGSIAVRRAGSAAQFTPIPTTVSADRLTALWDSDAYPAGSYEFRATGYDAAGNSADSVRRLDGTRMVLSNPLKHSTAVEFGFGGRQMTWHRCRRGSDGVRCHREVIESFERRPVTRSIAFGRAIPVAGRLLSASGSPLPGQTVDVIESFDSGASTSRRTTVAETGPDGAFLARLSPGPSRSVQVSFAGTRLLTRTGSRSLHLAVGTAVHLHASSASAAIGGAPVLFRGEIAHQGATIPAEGRPVQLQFRVGDTPWSEFRTVQTDAQGRFRYPYTFSDDDSRGVRFQFRAYAPPQPGWPYEAGTSRPVAVTGR